MLYCYVHLEIEALDENIGRWETTSFKLRILHLTVLIWWGTTSISKSHRQWSLWFCYCLSLHYVSHSDSVIGRGICQIPRLLLGMSIFLSLSRSLIGYVFAWIKLIDAKCDTFYFTL